MIRIEKGTIDEASGFMEKIPEFDKPYLKNEYEKRLLEVPHLILIAKTGTRMSDSKLDIKRITTSTADLEGYYQNIENK